MCVNMEACVSLQRRIFSEPGKFTLVSPIPSRNKLSTVANIALDPGGWKYQPIIAPASWLWDRKPLHLRISSMCSF